ncbi:MAG: hypothetical protein U5J98_11310 [Halobacteriales archaeon]|nr:hypothetical protein [Halobacteriales archaeon]
MARGVFTTVLAAMAREEWRLHTALFGGRRFGAFPLFVAAAGAGAVWLLVWTGTDPARIALGLHGLVLAFGLYTGSAGLVGRDAMRDLLGDVTLVVFSARTLPLAERRLLAAFLVKDLGYYAALFLLPLAVAYVPAAVAADTLARLPLLWATLAGTFVVGLVITFGAIAARTRGRAGTVALLAGAGAIGVAWAAGVDLLDLLPYGLYRGSATALPLLGLAATAALAVAGLAAFDPTHESPTRTAGPTFGRWHRRLPSDPDGLLAKTLLDVARSSGGVWKVAFSGGVLFLVTAALVGLAGSITGQAPSTGLSFGAVLGLSAFTTYNWVTQFDDVEAYLAYPVSTAAVFEAKLRAFVVLGLPTALGYYLLAIVLWGEQLRVAVAGAALLLGLSVYLFGLTVALAGLAPNEFLFDTLRFVGFTLGAAVPLVPILVVAFVVSPSTMGLVVIAAAGLGLGGVGLALFRWSVPRWAARYREG